MGALVRADDGRLGLERALEDAVALGLGVEVRLQLLEREHEVEDRDVARALVLLGARRRRDRREQRDAAHHRAAQKVRPRAGVEAVEGLDEGAVAVEIVERQIGHQRISSGVPTGSRRARRAMSALRRRMQPCEMRPGTSPG